jgi:hypothetical protein
MVAILDEKCISFLLVLEFILYETGAFHKRLRASTVEEEIQNSSIRCPVVLLSNVRRDVSGVSAPAEEFAEMLNFLRNADPERRLSAVVCQTPSARPVNGRAARQRAKNSQRTFDVDAAHLNGTVRKREPAG